MSWTSAEVKVLKELYPNVGARAVSAVTGRSHARVWAMARVLGVKANGVHGSGNKYAYQNAPWNPKND